MNNRSRYIVFILIVVTLLSSPMNLMAANDSFASMIIPSVTYDVEPSNDIIETIEISTYREFEKFVNNCKSDTYSSNKKFVLTNDIDISLIDFEGVPYFDGIFEGNGHVISFSSLKLKGSNTGLFRYSYGLV